ncbi:MAG: type III pantothenate kinase [Elusimicrobiota bacterium]
MTSKERRLHHQSAGLLLAIDVGNTHITIGLFRDSDRLRTWRLHTNRHATADELGLLFLGLLKNTVRQDDQVKGVALASVVPALDVPLEQASRTYLHQVPVVVGGGADLGIKNLYKKPEEVGADRLVNAVAVHALFKKAAIVVDFGTATTLDCVSARGEYLGGAICPGMELAGEWLASHTAKLPRVAFSEAPSNALGRTTKESLQSGLFFGYIGLVEGLLQRLIKEMNGQPVVVATGGLSPVIGPHLKKVSRILPNLTLEGLRLIWERNR